MTDGTGAPGGAFDDLLAANQEYAAGFSLQGLEARAGRGLALLTCMDSRIEPLAMLGLRPGDAKILRNAGGRVTDDVLRTLALGAHLLGVTRVLVVPHTRCRMTGREEDLHAALRERSGMDTRSLELRTTEDVREGLRRDLQRIRSWPYLPSGLPVAGAVYDVDTGRVEPLEE
ncbi:beta-class carbonic anhydrase [Vallicoccus soli]|uniref:carbonic anhydrase n=1 Tax=Vallicoccus soli TaxID=2339232 RepID=A0A3A3YZB1_9ACTN|nr:carbonic anhydrase [Vallicoccus soli]RJK93400.1 carbonic anhydrase [Vallicoccus soli]